MKKRIIAAMLVSALLAASLAGCSSTPSESVSSDKPGENSGEEPAVTTKQTESTAGEASVPEDSVTEPVQSETTPAESEVEEVKEQLKLDITEEGIVKNGSWYFTADNNGTTENYLYNFADKKVVKFDVEEGYEVGDISGYSVLLISEPDRKTEDWDRVVYRAAGKLIDAASNSVLAEDLQFIPSSNQWDYFVDDTLIVGKHEASFSSATDSIGSLSSSGEWIYPLSSETALNDFEGFDLSSEECYLYNVGSEYVTVRTSSGNCIYSLKTNSLVKDRSLERCILWEEDHGYFCSLDGDGMLWLCKYDFITNEVTKIAESSPSYNLIDDNKTICIRNAVYDTKTDKITQLTNILGEPTAYVNGILFNKRITGADKNDYFGAYNLNSEFVFEPIRADVGFIVPVGEKVIMKIREPDPAVYIFDTTNNTLTKVETDDSFERASFIAGDDDTVVIKKNVDLKTTYVLADIDDLTKTYSPFDA